MLENKIPIFILSLKILDNLPTIVGPSEHPTSPASAKKANSAVPPFFSIDEDILKVPGHKIPTENPQIPQPIRDNNGQGDREIII